MKRHERPRTRLVSSLKAKIVVAMGIVAFVVVAAIMVTNYRLRSNQLLREFQVFVRGVAGTAALSLSGEDINRIQKAGDATGGAEFQHARAVLEAARAINGLAEHEIYVLRPVSLSPDRLETEFVVMLQRKTFVGDRYVVPQISR